MPWAFAAVAASIYCLARAVADLRARRYLLGVFGLLAALVFLLTPISSQTVSIDLPAPARR